MENSTEKTEINMHDKTAQMTECITVSVNSSAAVEKNDDDQAYSDDGIVPASDGDGHPDDDTDPSREAETEEAEGGASGTGIDFDKVKKIGCISCCGVLVLMMAALASFTAVFMHFYRLMDITDSDEIIINSNVTFSDTEISEIPDGKVSVEDGDVFKDKDVFNLLLIGTDDRTKDFSTNARADSIMIMSFRDTDKTVRLVSLERGMLVKIPRHKNDILTHTFRYGGPNLLMETVRTHLKVDVNKYVRVNFAMFSKLVDEVGGVDIELTEREAYGLNKWPNNNTGKLDRKVLQGMNHFNGYEALQYSRMRWIDDDFHRVQRQRKVILAIRDNLTGLPVSKLSDICEDCLPYVQTNLSAMEFAGLVINMPSYLNNDIEQMTIPIKGTYKTLGRVDFKKNSDLLNEYLYD